MQTDFCATKSSITSCFLGNNTLDSAHYVLNYNLTVPLLNVYHATNFTYLFEQKLGVFLNHLECEQPIYHFHAQTQLNLNHSKTTDHKVNRTKSES